MFKKIRPDQVQRPVRFVDRFFIHCSAADNSGKDFEGTNLAKTVDRWHKQRGWSGIGYHYVIDKKGNLMTGRSINRTPAAQGGNNRGTLAVCLHGLQKHRFTAAQLETLYLLCDAHNELYYGDITFHGHCEVSAKSCPVIDYKSVLKLDKDGFMPYE